MRMKTYYFLLATYEIQQRLKPVYDKQRKIVRKKKRFGS